MSNLNLPWVELYRPNDLFEIVSQNNILNGLQKSIDNNNFQHVIFYGPSGSGKTTTILACAKYMYSGTSTEQVSWSCGMKLELNASDDRGISIIRDQVKTFASSSQFIKENNIYKVNTKLVILDEADQLTIDAQSALRKIIEQYTYNTRFCLICNNIDKIRKELKSRCMLYSFSPIPNDVHIKRLQYICQKENLILNDNALSIIINKSEGDMRKSINMLQMIYISSNKINMTLSEDNVLKLLGYPTTNDKINIEKLLIDKNINIKDTVEQIENIKHSLNLSTTEFLKIVINLVINNPRKTTTYILQEYGNIEYFMTTSYNDKLITSLIIGIFKIYF